MAATDACYFSPGSDSEEASPPPRNPFRLTEVEATRAGDDYENFVPDSAASRAEPQAACGLGNAEGAARVGFVVEDRLQELCVRDAAALDALKSLEIGSLLVFGNF